MKMAMKARVVYFNSDDRSTGDSLVDEWCDLVLGEVFDGDIDNTSVIVDNYYDVDARDGYFTYYKTIREWLDNETPQPVDLIGEWDIDSSYSEDVIDRAVRWCDEDYENDEERQQRLPVPFDQWEDWDYCERQEWYEENDPQLWEKWFGIVYDEWLVVESWMIESAKKAFGEYETGSTPADWWQTTGLLNPPKEPGEYSAHYIDLGFWRNEKLQRAIKAKYGIETDGSINDEVYMCVNNKSGKTYIYEDRGLFADVDIDSDFGQLILGLAESGRDLDDLWRFFDDEKDDLDVVLNNIETYKAGVPIEDIMA